MADEPVRFRTDCSRCNALCCVVFAHTPWNGFPDTKPANDRCRNLTPKNRCGVFTNLEDEGYTICRAYDCRGAGPLVSEWMTTPDEPGRLEQFRELARLHMLHGKLLDAGSHTALSLAAALDRVSQVYAKTGELDIPDDVREGLRRNEDLIMQILATLSQPKDTAP